MSTPPISCWDFVWFEVVQVLFLSMLLQSFEFMCVLTLSCLQDTADRFLWVVCHSSPPPDLQSSYPPFPTGPWALDKGCDEDILLSVDHAKALHSAHCPVVGLCVNYRLLQEEDLMRVERSSNFNLYDLWQLIRVPESLYPLSLRSSSLSSFLLHFHMQS